MRVELIPGIVMLLLGIIHFGLIVKHGRRFLLSDICLWVTAFSVGGSPIIALALSEKNLPGWEETIRSYIVFYLYLLGLAFSRLPFLKTFATTPLHVSQGWSSPIFFITRNLQRVPLNNILACFFLILLTKLYVFSKGGGIAGLDTVDNTLARNYFIVIIEFIAAPFLVAVSFYSIDCLLRKANMLHATVMLSGILLLTLLMGRRSLIYFGVLFSFSVFSFYGRITQRYLMFSVVFVALVFSVYSPFYLSFRLAAQSQAITGGDVIDIIYVAVSDVLDMNQYEKNQVNEQNLERRALSLVEWTSEIEAAVQLHGPLLGAAFVQGQMIGFLPRFLRDEQVAFNPKNYVQQQLGLRQTDATYSQAAQGVADFGILGGLLAGFFMGVFVNYGVLFAIKSLPTLPLFGLCIFSAVFSIAINPEITPGFELLVIRNLAILGLVLVIARGVGIRMLNPTAIGIRKE